MESNNKKGTAIGNIKREVDTTGKDDDMLSLGSPTTFPAFIIPHSTKRPLPSVQISSIKDKLNTEAFASKQRFLPTINDPDYLETINRIKDIVFVEGAVGSLKRQQRFQSDRQEIDSMSIIFPDVAFFHILHYPEKKKRDILIKHHLRICLIIMACIYSHVYKSTVNATNDDIFARGAYTQSSVYKVLVPYSKKIHDLDYDTYYSIHDNSDGTKLTLYQIVETKLDYEQIRNHINALRNMYEMHCIRIVYTMLVLGIDSLIVEPPSEESNSVGSS